MEVFAPSNVALGIADPRGDAAGYTVVLKAAFTADSDGAARPAVAPPTLRARVARKLGDPGSQAVELTLVGSTLSEITGAFAVRVGEREWLAKGAVDFRPRDIPLVRWPLTVAVVCSAHRLRAAIADPRFGLSVARDAGSPDQQRLPLSLVSVEIDVDTWAIALGFHAPLSASAASGALFVAFDHADQTPIRGEGLARSTAIWLCNPPSPVVRAPAPTVDVARFIAAPVLPFADRPQPRTPARTAAAPHVMPGRALPFVDVPPVPVPAEEQTQVHGLPVQVPSAMPFMRAPVSRETMPLVEVDEEDAIDTERPPPLPPSAVKHDTLPPSGHASGGPLPFHASDPIPLPRPSAVPTLATLRAELGGVSHAAPAVPPAPAPVQAPLPAPAPAPVTHTPSFMKPGAVSPFAGLAAPAAPRAALETLVDSPEADSELRVEGLTLSQYSQIRQSLLAAKRDRRAVLKQHGLGEVRWRIIERRWAAHFTELEAKPEQLVALAADLRQKARKRPRPSRAS